MARLVETKKIGGSLAVVIPKEVAKKENISAGDKVRISVKRVDELTELWGSLRGIKKPTQQIMQEIDENEDE